MTVLTNIDRVLFVCPSVFAGSSSRIKDAVFWLVNEFPVHLIYDGQYVCRLHYEGEVSCFSEACKAELRHGLGSVFHVKDSDSYHFCYPEYLDDMGDFEQIALPV